MNLQVKGFVSEVASGLKLSLPAALLIEAISNLQTIHIIFRVIFDNAKFRAITVQTKYVIKLTALTGSYNEFISLWSDYLSRGLLPLILTYFIFHIFFFVIMLILARRRTKDKLKKPLRVMAILYLLHSRILFFIIQYYLYGLIPTIFNIDNEEALYFNQARQGEMAFCITLSVINFCFCVVRELFLMQINQDKNAYAVKSSMLHLNALIHKQVALCCYFFITKTPSCGVVSFIVHLLCNLSACRILYFKLPFYNMKVLKMSIVANATILALTFTLFLSLFKDLLPSIEFVIWIIPPLFVKSFLLGFEALFKRIMKTRQKIPEREIHYSILLKEYGFGYIPEVQESDKYSYGSIISTASLMYNGASIAQLQEEKGKGKYIYNVYLHVMQRLRLIETENSRSPILLLFKAKIWLKKLNNISRAMALIKRAESLKLTTVERNSLDDLKESLRDSQVGEDQSKLTLLQYFKHKELATLIKDNIHHELQSHLSFWQEMQNRNLDMRKIILFAENAVKLSQKVEKQWQSYRKELASYCIHSSLLYAAYCSILLECPKKGEVLLEKALSIRNISSIKHPLDIYSDEVAVIFIGFDDKRIGCILNASGSLEGMFQIDRDQIIGRNFTILFPNIFAKKFQKMLQTFIQSNDPITNDVIKTYGKTTSNELFELELEIRFSQYNQQEMRLLVLLKKLCNPKPRLIINTAGVVIEYSPSVHKMFGTQNLNISEFRLADVFSQFRIINKAYNVVHGNLDDTIGSEAPQSAYYKNVNQLPVTTTVETDLNLISSPRESQPLVLNSSRRDSSRFRRTSLLSPRTKPTLSLEEAKEICDRYDQRGKLKAEDMCPSTLLRPMDEYDIKIEAFAEDHGIYKIVTILDSSIKRGGSRKKTVTSKPDARLPGSPKKPEDTLADTPLVAEQDTDFDFYQTDFEVKSPTYPEKSPTRLKELTRRIETIYSKSEIPEDEELNNKRRKKKLEIRSEGESSVGTLSKESKFMSAMAHLLKKEHTPPVVKLFPALLCIVMVFVSTLIAFNFMYYKQSMNQSNFDIQVIDIANQRMCEATRNLQWTLLIWARAIGLRSSAAFPLLKTELATGIIKMNQQNINLAELISFAGGQSFLQEMFKKDIDFWSVDKNISSPTGLRDSFMATSILVNKMTKLSQAKTLPQLLESNETIYIINSTANGYLVGSKKAIELTKNLFTSTVQMNISNLNIFLLCQMLALFSLCCLFLVIAALVVRSYKQLFQALLKIEEHQGLRRVHQLQKMKSLMEEDIQRRKFASLVVAFFDQIYTGTVAPPSKKLSFYNKSQKASKRNLIFQLLAYCIFALLLIGGVIALSTSSLLRSEKRFETLMVLGNQLDLLTNAKFLLYESSSVFYETLIFKDASTILFLNTAPEDILKQTIVDMGNSNSRIIAGFSSFGEGIADPIINGVLNTNKLCDLLQGTDNLICLKSLAGSDLGLLSVVKQYQLRYSNFYDSYKANSTTNNIKTILTNFESDQVYDSFTLEAGFNLLITYILSEVNAKVEHFTDDELYFRCGIWIFIVFTTIMIRFIIIKKFEHICLMRLHILKTTTVKILNENKALNFYLSTKYLRE